jgi:hypothetical protein
MQVTKSVKGKAGKQTVSAANWTKAEFLSHLTKITNIMHASSIVAKKGTPVAVFDNPHNHDLSKLELLEANLGKANVVRPPRYSGDFMQCIEHTHGSVCEAYHKQRFAAGLLPYNFDVESDRLRNIFVTTVHAESVMNDCIRVMQLVRTIRDTGHGDYAPLSMT